MLWKSIVEIIMDEVDSYIYVADYETSELIYMNSMARKLFGKDENDMSFINQKCYEVIQNKNEQCSFCKRNILNEKSFCQWHNYNEKLKQHFFNRDKIIKIDGKLYHIQISHVESERIIQQRKLEQQLEIERKLVKCATTLTAELPVQEAINDLLKILSTFYNSDRAYIFEINYEKGIINNSYEWVAEGITQEIDRLQNMPLEYITDWLEEFEKKGAFYISSLEEYLAANYEASRILGDQNISSLLAVPLMEKGKISGFLGIDNPRRNYDDFTLLSSVTYFLQNDLEKRKVYGKLERLSFEDALTGLYNRNKFNQVIEVLRVSTPGILGVIYVDLNGLKLINDKEGHEMGDRLLKRTGKILHSVFPFTAYRIGGDEFVMILPDVEKEIFDDKVSILRLEMKKENINCSIGFSWKNSDVNISEQMQEADKLMYLEKSNYYKMKQK